MTNVDRLAYVNVMFPPSWETLTSVLLLASLARRRLSWRFRNHSRMQREAVSMRLCAPSLLFPLGSRRCHPTIETNCRAAAFALSRRVESRNIYYLKSVILSARGTPSPPKSPLPPQRHLNRSSSRRAPFADRDVVFRIRKMMLKKRWRNKKRRVAHICVALFDANVGKQCPPSLHAFVLAVVLVFLRRPHVLRYSPGPHPGAQYLP
jgi:hypothetical protein